MSFPWFLLCFTALWVAVTGLLRGFCGWAALAKRFATSQPAAGESFAFASAGMGASSTFPVNYNSCLFLTVGPGGIRMSMLFLFRLGHPPLFIPWSEVESVAEKRTWFYRYAIVRIQGTRTLIRFSGRPARAVQACFEAIR
jgi:hypothetical protein